MSVMFICRVNAGLTEKRAGAKLINILNYLQVIPLIYSCVNM